MSAASFHPLRVATVERETDDAVSVAFDLPDALRPRFAFRPGQYLTLRAVLGGQDVRRSYSICSGLDDHRLRVAIKRVPGGRFSAWANAALAAGDTLDAMPPAGRFAVLPDPAAARAYLGVAAGSGITPVLSILKSVLAREPGSRFTLLYGSRSTASILFREELEALKDRHMARLSVIHVLSRERQDVPVLNGRLDGDKARALLAGLPSAALPDLALLCGPGGLIQSVGATLLAAGLAPAQVLSERFTPDGEPARPSVAPAAATAPPFATAAIIADGVHSEVLVADGETVLDAALRAGLDLPYACRGGMCSTCRARVTEGAVTMDHNYALEPWETRSGYVLTCQSRPTTARVTIDYDQV